jgi:SAM-dependent methyltransferase
MSDLALRDYYAARAGEYDDWYLRRGRYSHGPDADAMWKSELASAAMWLADLPIHGEIVELAAGTGWWSPALARRGELSLYDANPEPLAIATDRLAGAGLTARVEVRDAWAQPDRKVDALFMGFWLSHVPRARLGEFLRLCRAWLRPGGTLAFIDSRPDTESSATNHPTPRDDLSLRRLNDGREFTITKIYWTRSEMEAALAAAGFTDAMVQQTPRFFLLGRATAAI